MSVIKKITDIRLPLWGWAAIGVVLIGSVVTIAAMQPDHAGWRYGACKVFLERYIRYPGTLDIKAGGETMGAASIVFADTNPFGAEQIRVFECYFSTDKNGRMALSKITMDRKSIPDDITKSYNELLPLLSSVETDTALPDDPPSSLLDLKD